MKEYFGSGCKEILSFNKLDNFDALWDLKADWFEEPNIRRGGWSGVSKIKLKKSNGEKVGFFLKRQENHISKTITNPIRGIPTFEREFKTIRRFNTKGIPTMELAYYAKRMHDGNLQAILITVELEGFSALDSENFLGDSEMMKDRVYRESLIQSVAQAMRKMHDCGFQHNCFHLKHVFAKRQGNSWEIRLIDLEKVKRYRTRQDAELRDMYTLRRRATQYGWRRPDAIRFLRAYMQEDRLSSRSKTIWRTIGNKIVEKQMTWAYFK